MPGSVVGVTNRPSSVAQRIAFAFAQELYSQDGKNSIKKLNIVQKATERVGDVIALGALLGLVVRFFNKLRTGSLFGDSKFDSLKSWTPDAVLFIGGIVSKILTMNGAKLHLRKEKKEDYARNVIPALVRRMGVRITNLREPEDDFALYKQTLGNSEDKKSVFTFLESIKFTNNNDIANLALESLLGLEIVKNGPEFYLQTIDEFLFEKDGYEYGFRIDIPEGLRIGELLQTDQILLVARSVNADGKGEFVPVQKIDNTVGELLRNWLPPPLRVYVEDSSEDESSNLESRRAVERFSSNVKLSQVTGNGNVITLFNGDANTG